MSLLALVLTIVVIALVVAGLNFISVARYTWGAHKRFNASRVKNGLAPVPFVKG